LVVPDPLYPKVVCGYEETERGEDARAMAERVVEVDGGELNVVQVERGSPAEVLRELAETGEADLIVLGSTHRAAFGAVAPGSVAEHLLKGARSRLAIAPKGYARARAMMLAEAAGQDADDVPVEAQLPQLREEPRVFAVGFDGGPESLAALNEAAILAERFEASIRVIGVAPPPPAPAPGVVGAPPQPEAGADFQSRLNDAVAELPDVVRALPIYEKGDPVKKLLEHAAEGVDLLVLGSRGYGPVMRLIAGSVSVRVIRCAPCPVLLVPRLTGTADERNGMRARPRASL
jgi:nucleotide-binding universal stress UspA family protein